MKTVAARVVAAVVLIVVLHEAVERARVLVQFHRGFGRIPARSALAAWLEEAAVPDERPLVAAVQTYVPRKYGRLVDGIWQPAMVEQFIFAVRAMPSVFVEDEHYFNVFFAKDLRGQDITQPDQLRLFEAGREFYGRLETGGMPPYVLACFDRERCDTDNLSEAFHHPIRMFANRFSFSPNLAAHAALSVATEDGRSVQIARPSGLGGVAPANLKGALECRWPQPVLISAVHVGANAGEPLPLRAALTSADGRREEHALAPPVLKYHREPPSEQFLFLDEPRECVALQFGREGGGALDLAALREIEIIPAAPLGINPTRTFFAIDGDGKGDWNRVLNWRAVAAGEGIAIEPGATRGFALHARDHAAAVKELLVVFAGAHASTSAMCRFTFADGSSESPVARAWHSSVPDVSWLSFIPRSEQAVRDCECRVSVPADAGAPPRLIQIGAHLVPKPSDR
ncbi:MAG: hypothetical protein K1X78_02235 [Verrucomicrobiaceae bacterium]|nr:hypothetical protein [Verrucomicrobiaceae bacterium]